MNRDEKNAWIARTRAAIARAEGVVVVRRFGLNGPKEAELRAELRRAGVTVLSARNAVARIALAGTAAEALAEHLDGPTDLALLPGDWHGALKRLDAYRAGRFATHIPKARSLCGPPGAVRRAGPSPELRLVAAYLRETAGVVDERSLAAITALPPREALLAQVMALLQEPARRILSLLDAVRG